MSGNDLKLADSDAVEAYVPGLPPETTARASLRKFFPASLLSVGVGALLLGLPGSGDAWLAVLGGIVAVAGTLTGGFFAGLSVLRRRLYPDAMVEGRRSVIAGLLSPFAAFLVAALVLPMGLGTLETLGLFAVVGVVMAVLMFFAWLTPTPEEMRDLPNSTGGDEDQGQLPRGAP